MPCERITENTERTQRGRQGIAACLQQQNATQRGHAKLQCVETASSLEGVPRERNRDHKVRTQRGREGIAACLQHKNVTQWGHAKMKCVETAIRKAAEVAAKEMGNQELATKAGEEVSEWLSSENARLSRLATLPKQWRGKQEFNLPTNCHQYLGHVITIAWLLCLPSLHRRMDEPIAHLSFAAILRTYNIHLLWRNTKECRG